LKKRYLLFDLDGTLTDPAEGITNSFAYSLNKLDIIVPEKSELKKLIGPLLTDSFEFYFGMQKETAKVAIEYFREYFRDKGIFENKVYDGVEKMLSEQKQRGKSIILATSKATIFAERILEHFDIANYFDFVSGSYLDGTRVAKNDVIEYALRSCGITDRSAVIMIGDREHDIIGAKKTGIDSIGVLYGYGSLDELKNARSEYIAESIVELNELLSDI